MNEKDKQIICDPAKLVLRKIPGSCTLKYYSAFIWEGKECRFSKEIGVEKVKEIGGEAYTVDMTEYIREKIDELKTHLDAAPDTPPPS